MYMEGTMSNLKDELRAYMGERDLSIEQVAKQLGRHPLTIWKFLHGKTSPHDRTIYRIRALVGKQRQAHGQP